MAITTPVQQQWFLSVFRVLLSSDINRIEDLEIQQQIRTYRNQIITGIALNILALLGTIFLDVLFNEYSFNGYLINIILIVTASVGITLAAIRIFDLTNIVRRNLFEVIQDHQQL